MLQETPDGIILSVKVIPKSRKNEVVGEHDGELKIRITATPEKGCANNALIKFLAKRLGISKNRISLISGMSNRHKRILIKGVTSDEVRLT